MLGGVSLLAASFGQPEVATRYRPAAAPRWGLPVMGSGPLQSCMVTWAGLEPSNDWVYVLNRHFRTRFSLCSQWAFVGQACQSKAETFLFQFLEQKVPAHPMLFELQAKTWRNVLDTDDDDADWLLGRAKREPTNWKCRNSLKTRPESTSARVKSIGPGTRMVLKPGMSLAVSAQAREDPTGPLIVLGAVPVDLKFASLNTKVKLKYRC